MTDEQRQILARYQCVFPVPVGQLAEELGLTVISTTDLPGGMSGSISKEGDAYIVYVNAKQSLRRQRFTIAHEIGHFLKHKKYLDQTDEILNSAKKVILNHSKDGTASTADLEERRREYAADKFAGDLLMPEEPFRDVWFKAQGLKDVADFFGVSEMAANLRAAILGLGYFDEANGTAS